MPKSRCLALIRIMANCFQWLKGIATIVLRCNAAPRADEVGSACYLIARAAPAAGQSLDTALFQQVAQVTGRGGFGYLGHSLVLSGARLLGLMSAPWQGC